MKTLTLSLIFSLTFYAVTSHFDVWKGLETKARAVNNYKYTAMAVEKENKHLKNKINGLMYEIQELKAQINFYKLKEEKPKGSREIASIPDLKNMPGYQDHVSYEVYKWSPDKLLAIGDKEFFFKHYEKSAQFYHEFLTRFPGHKKVNDQVLFKAGVAAYESQKYYPWAKQHLQRLVKEYPKSSYFRGAKLWLALSHLNLGNKKHFYETVEEFRLKYRNTNEWKILSQHYEELTTKYQN